MNNTLTVGKKVNRSNEQTRSTCTKKGRGGSMTTPPVRNHSRDGISNTRTQGGEQGEDRSYSSQATEERLNQKQAILFDEWLGGFSDWMLKHGNETNPQSRKDGLAETTSTNYIDRIDGVYRDLWDELGHFILYITPAHADAYVELLAEDAIRKDDGEPLEESSKRKLTDALQKLFEWQTATRGGERWEPKIEFSQSEFASADEFRLDEWRRLRQVVLEYDTIPSYSDVTPEERDRWKAYLAQKVGTKKTDITPSDWEAHNQSWKIASLVWTSQDCGFRPVEIERAEREWFRPEKQTVFIPKDRAAKNRRYWEIALRPETARALIEWFKQRDTDPKYDGRSEVWLNQQANPYTSATLNYLLDNLCDAAGIKQANRKISWYSIRHSLGTQMTEKGNLAQTKAQLRHKSLESSLQYVHPSIDTRQTTLTEIG